MKKTLLVLALLLSPAVLFAADKILAHPHVRVETTEGDFTLELETKEAPQTVAHFIGLVEAGFYDGLVFHRVIAGFMVQGGGYTAGLEAREDKQTIPNESGNALSNTRTTVAMARTGDPHSANTQFFINLVDNQRLDPIKDPTRGRWGYTVFGYVIDGMDVVDKIAAVETTPQKDHPNAPKVPVVIEKMSHITGD